MDSLFVDFVRHATEKHGGKFNWVPTVEKVCLMQSDKSWVPASGRHECLWTRNKINSPNWKQRFSV